MIVESLVSLMQNVPHWLAVILLSALPVTEAQVTIPVAILSWNMNPVVAYTLAVLGNALPFFPLFFGIRWCMAFAHRRAPWLTAWLEKMIRRAHRKLGNNYEKFGILGLVAFIAIPSPGTGLWTGTLAAVALGLHWKSAAVGVFGGMLVTSLIVLILTLVGGRIAG